MSTDETHVSGLFQGTMTHMAPETLLQGVQRNEADVYAFGITLWELYTGDRPHQNIQRAILGYQVSCDLGYEPLKRECSDINRRSCE